MTDESEDVSSDGLGPNGLGGNNSSEGSWKDKADLNDSSDSEGKLVKNSSSSHSS